MDNYRSEKGWRGEIVTLYTSIGFTNRQHDKSRFLRDFKVLPVFSSTKLFGKYSIILNM